jgi:hypothetical protein
MKTEAEIGLISAEYIAEKMELYIEFRVVISKTETFENFAKLLSFKKVNGAIVCPRCDKRAILDIDHLSPPSPQVIIEINCPECFFRWSQFMSDEKMKPVKEKIQQQINSLIDRM